MCETTRRVSFLDLPAELRLRVYGLILVPIVLPAKTVKRSPVDLICHGLSHHHLRDKSPQTRPAQTIALPNGRYLWLFRGLVLACRQTYSEMEQNLLRLHQEAFNALGWTFLQRHSMPLDTPTLSRLGDTNCIKIGVPSTHIARMIPLIGRNKKYEITCATDDLIVALIGYFPSFSLYLAGAEWKMHHAKTIKTEEILHKLMFGILVKHAAGFGFVHGCKPTINNKLVLPNDHDFNWSRYVRPESSQRPRMLQFDYRL
jgi:hypothetical protein